jgi:hypothetical protein
MVAAVVDWRVADQVSLSDPYPLFMSTKLEQLGEVFHHLCPEKPSERVPPPGEFSKSSLIPD